MLSNFVSSPRKKKKLPWVQGRNTCRKKEQDSLLLIVCLFDFVGKFLANLSLKHSNGFSYSLSKQKLAPAAPSILEHASILSSKPVFLFKQSHQHGPIKIPFSYCLATSRAKGNVLEIRLALLFPTNSLICRSFEFISEELFVMVTFSS